MQTVYYDVENTLTVPFITGIQRVTRELSKVVLSADFKSTTFLFVPVIYDHTHLKWRRLSSSETRSLLSATPCSTKLTSRIINKVKQSIPPAKSLYLNRFSEDSFFVDMDSSWHSLLKRKTLLPNLKESGVRLVKLHYDIIPLLFPETTHPNTVKLFGEHLQSHIKHSELFLCISDTTRSDIKQYCEQRSINGPILHTIKLGTNPPQSVPREQRHTHTATPYGRYILAIGTIEPRKNYSLLLKAFEQIQHKTDLNVIIVGKTGWLADDITSQLTSHPAYGSRLHHLKHINDSQLEAFYQNAWLSVVPSLYEGFGLPVVESLARGCPTICSNAGSLQEVGADSVYFFSPESEDELASLILKLDSNNEEYDTLSAKARHYQPTNWQQTVTDIEQGLRQLL